MSRTEAKGPDFHHHLVLVTYAVTRFCLSVAVYVHDRVRGVA